MKRLDIHPSLFNLHSNASLNYSSKEGKVRGFDGSKVWNEEACALILEADTNSGWSLTKHDHCYCTYCDLNKLCNHKYKFWKETLKKNGILAFW